MSVSATFTAALMYRLKHPIVAANKGGGLAAAALLAGRVYPRGSVPQVDSTGAALVDYVTVKEISYHQDHHLLGLSNFHVIRVQVEAHARTESGAAILGDQVGTELDDYEGPMGSGQTVMVQHQDVENIIGGFDGPFQGSETGFHRALCDVKAFFSVP
jgi:hypothetical protein